MVFHLLLVEASELGNAYLPASTTNYTLAYLSDNLYDSQMLGNAGLVGAGGFGVVSILCLLILTTT